MPWHAYPLRPTDIAEVIRAFLRGLPSTVGPVETLNCIPPFRFLRLGAKNAVESGPRISRFKRCKPTSRRGSAPKVDVNHDSREMPTAMTRPSMRFGAIAVIYQPPRFLVIRRSQWVTAPGTLCFPGGGVEAGESLPNAVRREFREELGGEVEPLRPLWQSYSHRGVQLHWWQAELTSTQPLQPDQMEVAEYHWLTGEQLLNAPDLLDTNRPFLHKWLSGHFSRL